MLIKLIIKLIVLELLIPLLVSAEIYLRCKELFDYKSRIFDKPRCSREYMYLPILNGVYCYNNGSGLCKAFAGRFEFYFDSFKDQYLYQAPKSAYVDEYGYHLRVPISYNIKGDVIYADRSINWAKSFKKNLLGRKISLLSTRDFNWCGYTENDWWPYKSSIIDYKSNGRFHIFFHNRQSCIFDLKLNKTQHYNTRFLHKSYLRIDLDYNPTIFAMEDRIANDTRLVKHKRQHFYEVEYKVVENITPDIKYFVQMSDTQREPLKIDGTAKGFLLSSSAFNNSRVCLTDSAHVRQRGDKNNPLFDQYCGTEEIEINDWPYTYYIRNDSNFMETDLHNLNRDSPRNQRFYGINVQTDADWREFAKDGYVFSAMTTIPIVVNNRWATDRLRVIMMYSSYKPAAQTRYDEYYPMPYLSDYTAIMSPSGDYWNIKDREIKKKELKNLNYVDDIAYLYKCKTVLIIFGPLYSELPENRFSIDTKATVDSIDKLSIFEPANAFFAVPNSNVLWVHHRTNWVTKLYYTCASGPDELVTATKANGGKYYYRNGPSQPPPFISRLLATKYDWNEEEIFAAIGVFKGQVRPEAPDPALYPLGQDAPDTPLEENDFTLVYIIVGVGILLVVAMYVICFMTFRRRRRRQPNEMTRRSSLPSRSGYSSAPSKRSVFRPSKMGSKLSARSSLHTSQSHGGPSTRSSMHSKSGSSLGKRPSSRSSLHSTTSHGSPSTRSSLHRPGTGSGSESSKRSNATTGSTRSTRPINSATTARSGRLSKGMSLTKRTS